MTKKNNSSFKYFLLFAPFITFFIGYVGSLAYVHVSTLQVPNVVGKTIHEASLLLAKNNIAFKVLSEKEDSCLQEGTIISQIPLVGQEIKLSRPLLVVLAKKPKPMLMPDLALKNAHEIAELGNDLQRKITMVILARSHADGRCFAQVPSSGSELTDGKIFAYLGKKMPSLYVIPSFIGLPIESVKKTLKDQGVSYDMLEEKQREEAAYEQYVADQMPIPGTIMPLEQVSMQFSCGNR